MRKRFEMTDSEPATPESVERDLETARRLLQVAFTTGDLATLRVLVTDDVIWIAAGRRPWVGRTEVLDRLGPFFDRFQYDFRLERTRIDRDDNRALERSNFTSHVVGDDRPPTTHEGAVVILWVRLDRWRISTYLDIGGPMFG